MKKSILNLLAITFSLAVIFSSCSKAPNKILPKKDGLWTAVFHVVTTVGGTNTGDMTYTYAITFKSDGTASYISGTTTYTFTWVYDKKNKTVTTLMPGASSSQVFNVEEMTSKSEKWTYSNTSSSSGVTITIDETVNLTKV